MSRLSDKKLLNTGRTALGTFHTSIDTELIERPTLELVKIRASQINGCGPCLVAHWKLALELGMRIDKLATIDAWQETDWFSPREKAALTWAEALTRSADRHIDDATYEIVRAEFSEEEIVDLTWTIISINSWNRINVAFASQPSHFDPPTQN